MEFTEAQVTEIMGEMLSNGKGIGILEKITLEALMRGERDLHNEEDNDVSNGYRKRKLYMLGDTLLLDVPRTRRYEFMPVVLGILRQKSEMIQDITEVMVSRGNTMEDVSAVLEVMYGKRYSTSQISRIATGSKDVIDKWLSRPLPSEAEALMIDATYIKTRRGTVGSEAYLTAMALYPDGTRDVVGIYNNPSEGSTLWQSLFEDIKERGLRNVKLLVSDGLKGIEDSAEIAYPGIHVQLCTVHLERNLSTIPRTVDKREFMEDFKQVLDIRQDYASPEVAREAFLEVCKKWDKSYHTYRKYKDDPRLIYYFTYILYAHHQRRYIHTTNWVERLNRRFKKAVRNKSQMPDPYHGVYLLALVARDVTYLKHKIANLSGGLKELKK